MILLKWGGYYKVLCPQCLRWIASLSSGVKAYHRTFWCSKHKHVDSEGAIYQEEDPESLKQELTKEAAWVPKDSL